MNTSDDSFEFRKPAGDSEPQDDHDYYVLVDGEQKGPFALAHLCAFLGAGLYPRSAKYRRDDMSEWAPISDLDDEIQVSTPRQHHYQFAYFALPSMVFRDSPVLKTLTGGGARESLVRGWQALGQRFSPADIVPPTGLHAEIVPFTAHRDLLLVTFPTPRRVTEAYFAAILLPKANLFGTRKGTVRYFLLSHSGIFGENRPEGTIREISISSSGFSNSRVQDFVETLRPDFIEALKMRCTN